MAKRILTLLLALSMALSIAPAALAAAPDEDILPPPPADGPAAGVTLNTEQHINYIEGTGDGCFAPDARITRGEAALMLCRLLAEKVPVTVSYTDVSADSWYYDAALELGSLGVIRPDEDTFRGDEVITRGEFVRYITAFFPLRTDAEQFPDVDPDDENAPYLLSAKAYGWLEGDEHGRMNSRDPLHRSDGVALLNRALGRAGDKTVIDAERPALYLDVVPGAWYYGDVMEATVPHQHAFGADGETWTSWTEADTGLPDGFRAEGAHLIDGWSYYYDTSAKDILRGRAKNGFTAGADGRFTSGDSWIDGQLREIVLKHTDSSMSREEMRKALYAYVRDTYTYLGRSHYPVGDTSFTRDAAKVMLQTGKGNCYCYASVFWYLSRWIGYDAKIYSGTLGVNIHSGGKAQDHAWVEIDGLIYDTQLEWRQLNTYHRDNYLWYFYGFKDTRDYWMYRK